MKIGRIGSFTLALAIVICAVFSLRVWLIPADNKPDTTVALITKNRPNPGLMPDFSAINDVAAKKQAFFDFLRPTVRQQNAIIADERRFLESSLANLENAHPLTEAEEFRIRKIAAKYQYSSKFYDAKTLTRLLKRVDIIPEAMVLIQAANETGWGSSRFAREGLNFFGQWCFSSGCGLVPLSRNDNMNHEVKVFNTVEASVASYMRNLNSNAAYSLFRSIRADLRSQNIEPEAEQLIYGLVNYSERQEAYVDELLDMLRHNEQFLVDTHAQTPAA
ncbi:glucosaminidase domain-containing protein [Shewanella salipaludis]|uniref:Glucosaminidase n=1 Tax=Shewanella salipaludis TaxID=2723052 RepID=A0A972FWI5_9GAMM|nr:glucosaminidase domain-containing protein [Shewanella salipaludis]NMH63932.1 glucosaminidase [Shewanella salipaludis]